MTAENPPHPDGRPSVYRLDLRHAVGLFGVRVVLAAVGIALGAVCLRIGGAVGGGAGRVLAAAAVVLLVFAVFRLVQPPRVMTLTTDAYEVHRVPDCGVRSAPWSSVRGAQDRGGPLGPTLHFDLEGEGFTSVPLVLVAGRSLELQREVRERLNRAHGYQGLV